MKTTADVLQEEGHSQCIEYRRAHRRAYRARQRRIDYCPNYKALAAIEKALAEGWALSMSDAINQALTEWGEWMTQDDGPE